MKILESKINSPWCFFYKIFFFVQISISYPFPRSWISISLPESMLIRQVKAYTDEVKLLEVLI